MTEREVKVLKALQYIAYFTPAVFVVVGLPLALGQVSPNNLYGFRTQETLENLDVWYSVNSLGGWVLTLSGLIAIFVLLLVHKKWMTAPLVKFLVMLLLPVIFCLVTVLFTVIFMLKPS